MLREDYISPRNHRLCFVAGGDGIDQGWKDGGIGVMGRGRATVGVTKSPIKKSISKQDRKDLKRLADDFGLLYRKEVQDIIATCKSYTEGRQEIMRVYEAVYLR